MTDILTCAVSFGVYGFVMGVFAGWIVWRLPCKARHHD